MRTARPWITSLATVAGLTLLLAGCLKLDMAITISSDDTADGDVIFAVNKELLELTGANVEDVLGDTAVPSDIEGATQEPYDDGEFVGTRVRFDDVPIQELQERSEADTLTIARRGDTYVVEGQMDLTTQDAEASLEGNPFEEQIRQAFDSAEIRVAITFPGEVLETNGAVDGTTVTWRPVFGERNRIEAVASASGATTDEEAGPIGAGASGDDAAGSGLLWVLVALAVVIAIVALVVAARRRGGSEVAAPSGGAASPEPSAGVPPPPPPAADPDRPVGGPPD